MNFEADGDESMTIGSVHRAVVLGHHAWGIQLRIDGSGLVVSADRGLLPEPMRQSEANLPPAGARVDVTVHLRTPNGQWRVVLRAPE